MGVYRFEDLRVWQAAKVQCDDVGRLLIRQEFQRDRELSEQMNDAAVEFAKLIAPNEQIAKMLRRWMATLDGGGTSNGSQETPRTARSD